MAQFCYLVKVLGDCDIRFLYVYEGSLVGNDDVVGEGVDVELVLFFVYVYVWENCFQ